MPILNRKKQTEQYSFLCILIYFNQKKKLSEQKKLKVQKVMQLFNTFEIIMRRDE